MKNSYLLCLLLTLTMLYYAIPRFSINQEGLGGYFAICWFIFALLVVAGNVSALLFLPKKKATERLRNKRMIGQRKRGN